MTRAVWATWALMPASDMHTLDVDLDDGLSPAGDVDGRAQLSPPKRRESRELWLPEIAKSIHQHVIEATLASLCHAGQLLSLFSPTTGLVENKTRALVAHSTVLVNAIQAGVLNLEITPPSHPPSSCSVRLRPSRSAASSWWRTSTARDDDDKTDVGSPARRDRPPRRAPYVLGSVGGCLVQWASLAVCHRPHDPQRSADARCPHESTRPPFTWPPTQPSAPSSARAFATPVPPTAYPAVRIRPLRQPVSMPTVPRLERLHGQQRQRERERLGFPSAAPASAPTATPTTPTHTAGPGRGTLTRAPPGPSAGLSTPSAFPVRFALQGSHSHYAPAAPYDPYAPYAAAYPYALGDPSRWPQVFTRARAATKHADAKKQVMVCLFCRARKIGGWPWAAGSSLGQEGGMV
ncbi:hypothetical protein GGX14DRAFT_674490 [Mycena pura]|uniref:Uncharacterized protein n=1 Tax=Mycena pura TaxID=153505 RepID=A0AAD6Y0V9_9AGAR|nr:hypothetical protein GGX14DRAFT_674490 [Mycena pura]